jgi:hypothetical protein
MDALDSLKLLISNDIHSLSLSDSLSLKQHIQLNISRFQDTIDHISFDALNKPHPTAKNIKFALNAYSEDLKQ